MTKMQDFTEYVLGAAWTCVSNNDPDSFMQILEERTLEYFLELVPEDFDITKIPFGSAQIEAIVANHVFADLRNIITDEKSKESM